MKVRSEIRRTNVVYSHVRSALTKPYLDGPFEFRIEESADESKIKTMLTIWRGLIDAALGQDSKEIGNNNNKEPEEDHGHNNKKGQHGHGDHKKKDCIVM